MIKIKTLQIVTFAIGAAFLIGSTTTFAEYTQKQNEIIDPNERNTEQLQLEQSNPSSQQSSSQQQSGEGMSGGQSSGGNDSSNNSSGMGDSGSSDQDKKSSY